MSAAAIIDNAIRFSRRDLTPDQIERLRLALRYENPEWTQIVRGRREVPEWRMPPKHLSMLDDSGPDVVLPRGAWIHVRPVVPDAKPVDRRVVAPHEFTLLRELMPHQATAVAKASPATYGLIKIGTGGGKTTTAFALVQAIGQKTLFVAPTRDLVQQIRREAMACLGVEASVIDGKKRVIAPITICTYSALLDGRLRADLYPHFGAFIIDEAHRAGSPEFSRVIGESPAKYRYGLTATPHKDARGFIVENLIGPVRDEVTVADLVDNGRLCKVERVQVTTDFEFDGNASEEYTEMVNAIVDDPDRNEKIVSLVARECRDGAALGMVLTQRVDHVNRLAELIARRGLRVSPLIGKMTPKKREEALAKARAGELDVLVATQLADEGLDLPTLSRLFLCCPGKEGARFIQRVGRAMRVHPSKRDSKVFDFCDLKVGVLANQARRRAREFYALYTQVLA